MAETTDPAASAAQELDRVAQLHSSRADTPLSIEELGGVIHIIRAAYAPLLKRAAEALDWAIASENMPDHDKAIMQLYAVRADLQAALGEG